MSTCINHFCIFYTYNIFILFINIKIFRNSIPIRIYLSLPIAYLSVFRAWVTLSPFPLSQIRHAHKSPLGEAYNRALCGSFRAGEENNGGSTPYCGCDLRNGTPEITRCFPEDVSCCLICFYCFFMY